MTDTLRNQLLGLGFKPPAKVQARSAARPARETTADGHRTQRGRGGGKRDARAGTGAGPTASRGKPGRRDDIDLAKAYAIRAQREKDERIAAEREKQNAARKRREALAKLALLVKDQGLNEPDAPLVRHFPYGGKIKRVHVTAAQLKALNAGALGVLQLEGRYLLVTAELLARAQQVFAPAVALKVDPAAPVEDDAYADPAHQVPDDLVW